MRRSRNSEVITLADGTFIGFSLGADYCAEHECGIQDINRVFGIPFEQEELFGIEKRMITQTPTNLFFSKATRNKRIHFALTLLQRWKVASINEFPIPKGQGLMDREDILSMWDEKEFCIVVDKQYKNEIEELHQAFEKLDISIGPAPSGPFDGGGFSICIASKFPKEDRDNLYLADKEFFELQEDARKTGVYKKLKKSGKDWYALSPDYWEEDDERVLKFFLNPKEQHLYNYGWFTVSELKQWAKDKGPVVKGK